MTDPYTPTTEEIRRAYALEDDEIGHPVIAEDQLASFDRWLASHDAQVRAEALRDAADDFETYIAAGAPVGAGMAADKWLRRGADRIADTNHTDGDNT